MSVCRLSLFNVVGCFVMGRQLTAGRLRRISKPPLLWEVFSDAGWGEGYLSKGFPLTPSIIDTGSPQGEGTLEGERVLPSLLFFLPHELRQDLL